MSQIRQNNKNHQTAAGRKIIYSSNFSLTYCLCVKPFSCSGKKRAKRSRHRGGAVQRSLSRLLTVTILLPRLRAALPYVPLPALVEAMVVVDTPITRVAAYNAHMYRLKNRFQPVPRRGPGGGLGEGGSKPGCLCRFLLLCR